ncbi:hypothetical protein AcV5_001525 [Taiwanofungus camphoratus]|nr:hypothetical protein AcV5_001525 [Antrodia cinnamomea]
MSSQSANILFVAIFSQAIVQHYCAVAVTALVFYDYITTIVAEIELVWCRKFTAPSILYIMIRYLTMLYVVVQVCFMLDGSLKCERYPSICTYDVHPATFSAISVSTF